MTEILIARHGETEWNVIERFRGRVDIPLNDTGIKQAEALGRYLQSSEIEAIYCSPVLRARQTAGYIGHAHNLPVTPVDGLNDLDFGEWQGKTVEDVKGSPAFGNWIAHPERVVLPGGESLAGARQRAFSFVEDAVAKHNGKVVLVTHRVIVMLLVCALLGLDNGHFWNIKSDTAALTGFIYNKGRYVLNTHNEKCHLNDIAVVK